ncbi:MAG: hypothetical protein IIT65_08815, partial [Lachnospiraceae bacterium]|nr:hypothetical protein [Lachnospiraceae bacterium]
EYKYKTMKNLIGSGFSRTTIYFGKFITAIIVSIAFIIFNKVCEIISDVIVKDPITFTTDEMLEMVRSLGMYAIIFILCMLIISDGLSLLAAVIYSIFGKLIIFMLEMFSVLSPVALKRISLVLLLTSDPKGLDEKVLVTYPWLWNGLGIILAIILLIAGLEIFKRKEFK